MSSPTTSPKRNQSRSRSQSPPDSPNNKPSKPKGTTFLRDNDDDDNVLPRPLPKGITYVSNFTSFNDLMDRNILQVDEDEKVHLSTDEVLAIYRAKCEDQGLQVSWQRESRFMELISKNCKGLTFSLRENGLGYLSAQCIAQVLSNNHYYALLDLSGNRLRDAGAECIAQLLERNDTIVHLALKSNDIGSVGGEALSRALESNFTLTSLDLSGISGINRNHLGTKGAQALSGALQINNVLCILNLGSNGLGKDGMGLLSQGLVYNKTITDLDLSSNNLGWEGCQILATILDTSNFKKLNLERNFIGDRGCTTIVHCLKPPKRAASLIESLDLGFNGIKAPGYKPIAEAIRINKVLKTLRLDGNDYGGDATLEFATAIRENRSLTELALNKNEISPEAGKSIGEALSANTCLQCLELADNNISNLGITALCLALKKEKCAITNLDVSNNKISDKGGLDIATMIRTNTVLQNLNIKQNNLKVAGDRIAEALKNNKTILSLDFTFNDFSYKSFSSIEQTLQRNLKIYKATAGERLMNQIQLLKRDEELLFLTRDNIEEEVKQREMAKEKVKQKRESLKKTVSSLKANLQELEDELESKQRERQKEEEINQKMADDLQKHKAKMDRQTSQLQRKIEQEQEKIQKLTKQLIQSNKAIQKIIDTEEEVFQPILDQLRVEEQQRDTARDDAKWEAEKLVQWELKLKNLEKALSGDDEAKKKANAAAASAGAKPKEKSEGKKKSAKKK